MIEEWQLLIVAIAALVVSIATLVFLFMILNRVREKSRKSFQIASRLEEEWEKFSTRESEERQRLAENFTRFETDTRDRVDKFEKVATGTRERLIKLEQYLKEFFEVELKTVFESFDKTVASILDEMKAELLRGVERIEDIQAVVDSKSFAQDRILDGEGSVYRLIADTSEGGGTPADKARPEEANSSPSEADETPMEPSPDKPPRRLRADEAE